MAAFGTWSIPNLELTNIQMGKLTANGRIELSNTGRISVHGQLLKLVPHGFFTKLEISGLSTCQFLLLGKDVRPLTINISNVTDFILNPYQLVFSNGGQVISWTQQRFWLKNIKVHGTGKFSLNGFDFMLEELNTQRIPGEIGAILTITSSTPNQVNVDDLINELCWILSLAQRLSVSWVKKEVTDGISTNIIIRQIERDCKFLCPLISTFSQDTCNFINSIYPVYTNQIQKYDLPVIIDYYVRAHTENVIELKFALASILMERLKFDWALNASGGTYTPVRKQNGLIKHFIKPNGAKATFEELLVEMANTLGYSSQMSSNNSVGTFTFIDNRNAIFHTGLSAASQLQLPNHWVSMKQELDKLLDQVDNILLRILGYSGKVILTSSPNTSVVFP